MTNLFAHDAWPALPYAEFAKTSHFLHMTVQMIGKLKLHTAFEPHWGNVALWPTARGVTSGLIPYQGHVFQIDLNMIEHTLNITTSWETSASFDLASLTVAQCYQTLFDKLKSLNIDLTIDSKPQEVEKPIRFEEDQTPFEYNALLANAWWRILLSSYLVLQKYHARFDGETPPIGLMWGTFDLRDARYNGTPVPTTGINAGYIRRNAMNEAQIEIGWWSGNDAYPKAAYYSFTYPQPEGIQQAKIRPAGARWDAALSEFILDYDNLRGLDNPAQALLDFCESTYEAGARLGGWQSKLITTGKPV